MFIVTGGAGFIGSHLIGALVKKYPEKKIVSIDNYFTGKKQNHIDHENVAYIEGHTKDIRQISKDNKLDNIEAIFHLGEYSRIVQSFDEFDRVWDYNIVGSKEVISFSSDKKAKLVYAGSSSKFGNDGIDENLSPYAWMKAKVVELIKNYSTWYDLDYVITYFYNVYGPGQIKEGNYATVIGIFENQYEQGNPLTVVSPGTQTRDFTHIDDIISGILVCFEKGKGDGYQLGAGEERQIIEVAKMFNTDIKLIPAKKGERKHGQADYSKVAALGWKPEHKLEDYINEFLERQGN